MHMHGRRGHALAHRHGIVIEKAVENAVSVRRPPDIDQAYQLGRIDYKVSNLLGNKHIATEQCRIIQPSVHFFPLEVDIVRSSCFLTPEAVECREFRTFESRDIHVLIQFQFCRKRLAYNCRGAAYRKFQEQIFG